MKKILSLILAGCLSATLVNAQSLSHSDFLTKVVEYSNLIKSAQHRSDAAAFNTAAAKTNMLPSISGSSSFNYQFNPSPMSLGVTSIDLKKDGYDAQVGVVQNVYSGGAARSQVNIAKEQEKLYSFAKSQTLEGVIYQAEAQYWTTAAYAEMLKVMQEYVLIVGKLGIIINNRFEQGAASKTDHLMVETRKKEAELQLSNTKKSYEVAVQNLNIMMGVEPEQHVGALDSIGILLPVASFSHFDSVLANRADFRIAEKNISLQEHATKVTLSKYYPQLVAGVKETWGTQSLNISGDTRFNTIAFAQLNVPIFSWFQRSKVKSQNVALIHALESQKDIVVDNARSELNNAVTSLKQSYEQISVARTNLDYATQSLDLNTYSYEQGRLGILDVLSAQLSWIQAYTSTINAYLSNKLAIAGYNKALGNLDKQVK